MNDDILAIGPRHVKDGAAASPIEAVRYRQSMAEVCATLATDANTGLSDEEAANRLGRHGPNILQSEPPAALWRKLLAQFTDVLVILLIVAAAISAASWAFERDTALPYEAIAIFVIVLLNAVMGFVLQARAQEAVAGLARMSAPQANVVRNGVRRRIEASDLVPGDLILVEEGDTVPADARLTESVGLQMAEAPLTGESVPVSKDTTAIDGDVELGDRSNMIFSGTAATYGRGFAIVTATGMQSEIGHIAVLLKGAISETTPLRRELDRVGRLLAIIVVAIAIVMIATIFMLEDIHGFAGIVDVMILGVALAVAAVPEGLPAVVTAVLSVGVQRMAKRNVIVRHLVSVETLGSTDVIASDKTGTLTRNEMTVRRVVTASGGVRFEGTGYDPVGKMQEDGDCKLQGQVMSEAVRTLQAAALANNAVLQEKDGQWTIHGDPTEAALIVAARKAGLGAIDVESRFSRIAEVPFSSQRKLMSVVIADVTRPGEFVVMTKGAPGVILERCESELVGEEERALTSDGRTSILAANDALAGNALRTLGFAFRRISKEGFDPKAIGEEAEQDLVFLGLIGMIDPPRDEARSAVALAKSAGIRPIMITGDHSGTASVIAAELGISSDGRTITGSQLRVMDDAELDRTVLDVSVYARVDPEHKLRIVAALQRHGMTVAMTGDGVNDAPALKAADIGVAMGITGTDVSKEAADMVLVDDNFASIVAAVEEGRAIFSNIRKFLRYLLSSNFGEVLTMFFGVMLADVLGLSSAGTNGLVLPLLATQILWINLLTDGLPALALGVDPTDPGTMDHPPRPRREGVITRSMWNGIAFVGVVMAAGTLLVLDVSLPGGLIQGSGTLAYGQTMAFTTLVLFQLFNVFNARSDRTSAFAGLFRNRWLWGAVATSALIHVAVVYVPLLQTAFSTVPLSVGDWIKCVVVASSVLWLRELSKLLARIIVLTAEGGEARAQEA